MNYKSNYYKAHGLDQCDIIHCSNCGSVATQIHHVIYKSQCGTDDPSNLLPLCFTCHYEHHNNNSPTTEQLKEQLQNYTL